MGGELDTSFVLPGIFSDDNPAQSASADALHIAFADGAVIEYEPQASALTVSGIKTANITTSSCITLGTPEVGCTSKLITGTMSGDILPTPVGSRVMRRDYGSLLSSMIDQPQSPALELQTKVACYFAVLKWEPRITLSAVTTERQFDGWMIVSLTGEIASTGETLWLTIPVAS